MDLDTLIEELENKMERYDLTDSYLCEHKHPTREEIGAGEYAYGISMVPCSYVYPYLLQLQKILKENPDLKRG